MRKTKIHKIYVTCSSPSSHNETRVFNMFSTTMSGKILRTWLNKEQGYHNKAWHFRRNTCMAQFISYQKCSYHFFPMVLCPWALLYLGRQGWLTIWITLPDLGCKASHWALYMCTNSWCLLMSCCLLPWTERPCCFSFLLKSRSDSKL